MGQNGKIEKIKILHIITRLVRGGADENTIFNIHGLDKNTHDVDLLVGGESDFKHLKEMRDINFYVIPELKRNTNPWYDIIACFKLIHFIKGKRYLVVHTHTAKAGLLGRIAAKMVGTPVIIHTLHGITFHDFVNPFIRNCYVGLEKIAGYLTDRFITVGEDLKKKYLAQKIGYPSQYTTIYSGFKIDDFFQVGEDADYFRVKERSKLGISEKDIIIGTVSRLEPRKGHIYLFQAASQMLKQVPNLKFLIVGEGSYRKRLEEEVTRLNLTDKIIFLGYKADIARTMTLFDIFVLTSLWEGLPRVLVQAAAVGKPIVTFDVEGAREVVKEGVNGFIVSAKNTELLTERLLLLANDLSLAQSMGLKGKKIVNNCWDVKTMVEKTSKIYQDLISRKLNSTRFFKV